jgi:hypothetical protein
MQTAVCLMKKDKFEDYISVDSHVATCGVETVQELCVSLVASGSVAGEGGGEEDGEPEVVPSFAEMREALMKVKSFFYAHSTSDSDRESVLGLEKSYFELRSLHKTNLNETFFPARSNNNH